MNKTQRKREARAKKARAKAARKARKEALVWNGAEASSTPVAAAGNTPPVRAKRATAAELHREFQEQLAADPELREAVMAVHGPKIEQRQLERTAEQAGDDLLDAQAKVKQAHELESHARQPGRPGRRITDQRALEMLEDAAEAVHEVLLMVRDALRGVSPERREAVREILNAKPVSGVDGRRQPRRAPDPVVTLQKLDLQASSLLKRILAKTNPNVGKKAA